MNEPQWKRSSKSAGNGQCVEIAFRKSSYSGMANGECVEVAARESVHIRDSKDPGGPWLRTSREAFGALLGRVKAGELDLP